MWGDRLRRTLDRRQQVPHGLVGVHGTENVRQRTPELPEFLLGGLNGLFGLCQRQSEARWVWADLLMSATPGPSRGRIMMGVRRSLSAHLRSR